MYSNIHVGRLGERDVRLTLGATEVQKILNASGAKKSGDTVISHAIDFTPNWHLALETVTMTKQTEKREARRNR